MKNKNYKKIKLALIGIGGYGTTYLQELFNNASRITPAGVNGDAVFDFEDKNLKIFLSGTVEPSPDSCKYKPAIEELNIPIYPCIEELFECCNPELTVLSTPIHLHCSQILFCLENGSNVLCEKPLCVTTDEAKTLCEAVNNPSKTKGCFVAIGFQWSFTSPVLNLKRDVIAGNFGAPIKFKSLCFGPRDDAYYTRNSWAGKIKINNNVYIYDSPLSNATSHFLHNMLFVLGGKINEAAYPYAITAELYRAKPIENFDTAALRLHLRNSPAEIIFYTSHSVSKTVWPICEYIFENAIAFYPYNTQDNWAVKFNNGKIVEYGSPNKQHMKKFWESIEAVISSDFSGIVCDIRTATPHVICVNEVYKSSEIIEIPKEYILCKHNKEKDTNLIYVPEIEKSFSEAYEKNILPGELGKTKWMKTGSRITCGSYNIPKSVARK